MAEDVTAEADSGGHTDNQPAIVLLPTMLALRDQMQARARATSGRSGSAPPAGSRRPWAAAAAFAMGAAYVVTGSVNQSCVEAGTSDAVRRMLAQAQQADIAMAPAADMFEMGVKVQVLKRGTLFAMRAAKLYELYRAHDEPRADSRRRPGATLEKTIFRAPLADDLAADPGLFRRARPVADRAGRARSQAEDGPGLPLVSGHVVAAGPISGEPARTVDYQIWCGPAMAAFNDWVRGTFLEASRESPRGDGRLEHPLRRGRADPRPDRAACRASRCPPGVPRLTPLEVAEIENRLIFS